MICDFAEVYHIYDFRVVSVLRWATLLFGLGENSRVMRAVNKQKISVDTMLYASMVDLLNALKWMQTKDAQKGRNKPKSVLDFLLGKDKKENDIQGFANVEEFEITRNKLLKEGSNT